MGAERPEADRPAVADFLHERVHRPGLTQALLVAFRPLGFRFVPWNVASRP